MTTHKTDDEWIKDDSSQARAKAFDDGARTFITITLDGQHWAQIECAPIGGLVLYMLREQSTTRWVGPDTDKKEMTDEQRQLLRESAISLFRSVHQDCEEWQG
jgi:hypothetical protein